MVLINQGDQNWLLPVSGRMYSTNNVKHIVLSYVACNKHLDTQEHHMFLYPDIILKDEYY